MGPKIGIAITTYNRANMVLDHVERFRAMTASDFEIVVCDDGSSDNTVEQLKSAGVTVISGKNAGIAWNKNRGIFYFNSFVNYDFLLAIDDDVFPRVYGWDLEWIKACEKLGHVTINYDGRGIITGERTADKPGLSREVCGQALGFRRDVLVTIGYFDPRYGKYGHEHTDVTLRCIRAGHGGLRSAQRGICFYVIEGGLGIAQSSSHIDQDSLSANAKLLQQLATEPIFRSAYRDDEELRRLLSEMSSAAPEIASPLRALDFDEDAYLAANPDVARAKVDPLAHYLHSGLAENRRLCP